MHPLLEPLSEQQRSTLDRLVDVFLQENAITNLSALRTPEACFNGNVLDSLAFLQTGMNKGSLLDVGTGGGFPLLPVAIACPTMQCHGLEAVGKKVKAVERMAAALQLTNVHLIAERTEILGQDKKHREQYDIVTARAVAPLNILLEYCAPFVKKGGSLVLWKSTHIAEEHAAAVNAAAVLGLTEQPALRYTLPGDWGERQLLIYRKTSSTPPLYPRRIGEAKRHPITER